MVELLFSFFLVQEHFVFLFLAVRLWFVLDVVFLPLFFFFLAQDKPHLFFPVLPSVSFQSILFLHHFLPVEKAYFEERRFEIYPDFGTFFVVFQNQEQYYSFSP